ncbi:MAG: response regulator transcription factor [Hyphomicrobiaceae bacterium]
MRILLIEDEPLWQQNLAQALSRFAACEIATTCGNLASACEVLKVSKFDLIIVDLVLPDGSGIEAIKLARKLDSSVEILVATVFDDEQKVVNSIQAGATGYLLKDSTPDQWHQAIADICRGYSPLSPKVSRLILKRLQLDAQDRADYGAALRGKEGPGHGDVEQMSLRTKLTLRELEVLRYVARGLTMVEAARVMKISETTVRTHARSIYRKLDVSGHGEAVFEARRLGIL